MGVNSAGLRSKLTSFKKVVSELKPSVFFIQETKYKEPGRIKMDNYIIYELVRKSRDGGGGLAIGVDKDLQPAWVREGDDQVEALSVEIFLKNMKIRCCNAYGCQENESIDKKEAFWTFLDEEVAEAEKQGSGFILHFDGNLWAGSEIIPKDPRPQNKNGKLFEQFLNRNPHLTVVNALPLCEGLITRSRKNKGNQEESILDFFVVCNQVLPFVTKMVIDEEKRHILTNYQSVKTEKKAINSDHYTEYMDVNIEFKSEKPEREEIHDYKNKESQEKFKALTTQTKEFTRCFESIKPLENQIDDWMKILRKFCQNSFKKIRIKKRKLQPIKASIAKLIDLRNSLKNNSENKAKIYEIEEEIAKIEAEENRKVVIENFKALADNPEKVNLQEVWKLNSKLWPKNENCLPVAKINHKGKLVSAPRDIKKLLAEEYKNRLRSRPLRSDLKSISKIQNKIFQMKMILANSRKSENWKMEDLEKALNNLKKKKARDSEGLKNEIFKLDVIGDNLKLSLLHMFNRLKSEKMIPKFFNITNITTIHKSGSRTNPRNERGIFRVSVLRYIMMRLIYDKKYQVVDQNMSDCQMGARKNKGCKNNIFIVNGIIHEVMKSKTMKPVVLQIYDYQQMFDSIDLQKALTDIYDAGINDDTLVLLHEANKDIDMAVKTPYGLTERQNVKNIVLQGDTFGSILASVQVDSIGKECMAEGHGYMYKGKLPIAFLGLVDDIIGISNAGIKAQMLNSFLNAKTAEKTLQFGNSKCKYMVVGKDTENMIDNNLKVDEWKISYTETGDITEHFNGQTPIQKTEQQKYLGFVLSSTGDNMVNIHEIRKKSIGIIRKIINKLNSLKLRNYYFECAVIFMLSMLRPSILYASEMYYNLKECQLRQIEKIEESYLRKVFKTTKGCPISQLYLEIGVVPARFEIKKLRLLYLKYILSQNEDSLVRKFFNLQLNEPSKGDWAFQCQSDLKELKIHESFEEIRNMTHSQYLKRIKSQILQNAFEYLNKRRKRKGKEIEYTQLEMAEYLLPINKKLTIEKKREMFSVRNRMINIESNFKNRKQTPKCLCQKEENMEHIWNCQLFKVKGENNGKFEQIFKGNLKEQIEIFEQFIEKFERYNSMKNEKKKINTYPGDPNGIHCSMLNSKG